LRPAYAAALLQLVGVDEPTTEGRVEGDRDPVWAGAHTSVVREALARREQAALRELLLDNRKLASCDLCGRELPSELLVAARVVCAFVGCDGLAEAAYLALASPGSVHALSVAGSADLAEFAPPTDGRHCTAHATATARRFAAQCSRASRPRQDGSVHLW